MNLLINPLLTVVVTVYNKERYLEECLNSIIKQTYKKLDIIIVNDGSTDSSPEICDRYLFDERVRVIHQKNIGVKKSRLVGVRAAKSKYVTFVDADDKIDETMYELMMEKVIDYDLDMSICGQFFLKPRVVF